MSTKRYGIFVEAQSSYRGRTRLVWLLIALVGVGGGIVNALLLESNTLLLPKFVMRNGHSGIHLGFLSNVAIGVAGAFLTYLLGSASLSTGQQVGLALVGSIGGSSFVSSFVQRQQVDLLNARAQGFREAAQELMGKGRKPKSK